MIRDGGFEGRLSEHERDIIRRRIAIRNKRLLGEHRSGILRDRQPVTYSEKFGLDRVRFDIFYASVGHRPHAE